MRLRLFAMRLVLGTSLLVIAPIGLRAAILSNGNTLSYGSSLTSDNGTYHLQHVLNGGLGSRVLMWDRPWCGYSDFWDSFRDGQVSGCGIGTHMGQAPYGDANDYLAVQSDGNVVLYNGSNTALWWTSTDGYGSSVFLNAQNDGNLVVYYNTNVAIWSLY